MRGSDREQGSMFSYVSLEARIPADHPLRPMREMVDEALEGLARRFRSLYAAHGSSFDSAGAAAAGPAAAGALLGAKRADADGAARVQPAVSLVRGPGDGRSRSGTRRCSRRTGTGCWKARWRRRSSRRCWRRAREHGLLSSEHFTVDGTLIEAWASQKSFRPQGRSEGSAGDDDPGNPTVNFQGERRSNDTHASTTDPEARLARKKGQDLEAVLHGPPADGEPQRSDRLGAG